MSMRVIMMDDELTMRTQLEFKLFFDRFIELENENHEEKSTSNR